MFHRGIMIDEPEATILEFTGAEGTGNTQLSVIKGFQSGVEWLASI